MYTHNSPFMCSATYYISCTNTILYAQRYDMAFSRSQQHGWNPKATLFTLFTSLVLLSWIYIQPCVSPVELLSLSSAFYLWKTFINRTNTIGLERFEREFVQPNTRRENTFCHCIGVRIVI